MKCESPITYHSKDMTNVKVFESGSNLKVKVSRSKILVPIERSVERNTHMKYESPIIIHKIEPMLKILQTDRWTGQKLYVSPIFR
jgi:hypothetical protein